MKRAGRQDTGRVALDDVGTADNLELLRQQTSLARFGELALRSGDLDEILTEACRLVGEGLGTDLAKVVELQEGGKTLLVRAGVGWKPGVIGVATIQVADNTSEGVALRTGEPMISPDIAEETRFQYPSFLTENGVRAVVNVVIIGGEDKPPFGILQVDSRKPRQFSESDIAFLTSYANLLAGAVDRLRFRIALEETVADRTRELTEANAKLQAEAAERERIEDVLRQAQKMEAVGQLTGGLAHDFNNLLAGIFGSLQLIRIRVAQGRTAELDRYIETAMTSLDRAAALTHRLLAFSRRQVLDPKPTDVNRLVGGLEDLFRRTVGPSVKVEIKLATELWLTLCDPNQLENALLNLVINARDAMPDGGRLLIETANDAADLPALVWPPGEGMPLANHPAHQHIALVVTDTGGGMAPDVVARAFDPFFTTKPLGEGTGLGLSMVYGFVKQSGGHVLLRSDIGKGTTVTVYLPRQLGAEDSEEQLPVVPILPPVEKSITVLVVEDEPAVRMVIAEMLSDRGYTVLEAYNGRSGLNTLQSSARIDLLLTDVGLPGGMNGRQLAEAARKLRPGLKMLFLTGYAESAAFGSRKMEHGMEVMTKPFELDVLAARVQEIISD